MVQYKDSNFINLFFRTSLECWDEMAVCEYNASGLTYSELALRIKTLQELWEKIGIKKGEKICIFSRNCLNFPAIYMAAVSYGYVCVLIPSSFNSTDVQYLINHSGSRLLYIEKDFYDEMDYESMPNLLASIDINNLNILVSKNKTNEYLGQFSCFEEERKIHFSQENYSLPIPEMESLCTILYTSGSIGNPKGVMISIKNLSYNAEFDKRNLLYRRGDNYLSILPFSHAFGLGGD